MSEYEQFIRDYFRLGRGAWLKAYAHRIPAGMGPRAFVDELRKLGLENDMVDPCDWSDGRAPKGSLYLVAEGAERYCIYTVDRAIPFLEGTFGTLEEALLEKAKYLFMFLALEAMPTPPLRR